jgi:hypothetical protein
LQSNFTCFSGLEFEQVRVLYSTLVRNLKLEKQRFYKMIIFFK